MSPESIQQALNVFVDPFMDMPWGSLKILKNIEEKKGLWSIQLELPYPILRERSFLEDLLKKHLTTAADLSADAYEFHIETRIQSHTVQQNLSVLPAVKNTLAVASGKGGVGKSTVAVNLALALAQEGARVGILDADIYGPSIPTLLNLVHDRPAVVNESEMEPLLSYDLQAMSIGFLVDVEQPLIWRGPMVSSALQQLLQQTRWNNLDYLIIDLPPGTGDIQLTLCQKIPLSAAVLVTTPQDLAVVDARRAFEMFQKVQVPVLGILENMSHHVCTSCGHTEAIFGEGGGRALAAQAHLPLLGQIPLVGRIRQEADTGCPTVVAEPESSLATLYRKTAIRVAAQLALQQVTALKPVFPRIVVE